MDGNHLSQPPPVPGQQLGTGCNIACRCSVEQFEGGTVLGRHWRDPPSRFRKKDQFGYICLLAILWQMPQVAWNMIVKIAHLDCAAVFARTGVASKQPRNSFTRPVNQISGKRLNNPILRAKLKSEKKRLTE
jgi:hypothetical protein